jgi:hypothetical protein
MCVGIVNISDGNSCCLHISISIVVHGCSLGHNDSGWDLTPNDFALTLSTTLSSIYLVLLASKKVQTFFGGRFIGIKMFSEHVLAEHSSKNFILFSTLVVHERQKRLW